MAWAAEGRHLEAALGKTRPYGILEREEETECMTRWPFATSPKSRGYTGSQLIWKNITSASSYSTLKWDRWRAALRER